jgi:aspartyl protease family protein
VKDLPLWLKTATIWLVVSTVVFVLVLAIQRHQEQTRFTARGSTIELRRENDGHYHWPGTINGRAVDFLVDSGATGSAIPAALARELGLLVVGQVRIHTASGVVDAQVVQAEVRLRGGLDVARLRLSAMPDLGTPLIGMDVLGRLDWRHRDGVLLIELHSGGR